MYVLRNKRSTCIFWSTNLTYHQYHFPFQYIPSSIINYSGGYFYQNSLSSALILFVFECHNVWPFKHGHKDKNDMLKHAAGHPRGIEMCMVGSKEIICVVCLIETNCVVLCVFDCSLHRSLVHWLPINSHQAGRRKLQPVGRLYILMKTVQKRSVQLYFILYQI